MNTKKNPGESIPTMSERYLSLMDSEIKIAEEYHAKKESMAWTAAAAYFGAIVVLGHTAAPLLNSRPLKILFAGLLLSLSYATFFFLNMQFEARWKAADSLERRRNLRLKLIHGEISNCDLQKCSDFDQMDEKRFQEKKKEDREDRCSQFKKAFGYFALPKCFLLKVDARMRSELSCYVVLFIVTLIAVSAALFGFSKPNLVPSRSQTANQRVVSSDFSKTSLLTNHISTPTLTNQVLIPTNFYSP